MHGFAMATVAAALGFAPRPAAGLSVGGTAGADWLGMVHVEGSGWAHVGSGDVVRPFLTTKTEVAWVARAGAWRFGPAVALDLAYAVPADQECTGVPGGCLYPGVAGGIGAWARHGGWEAWAGLGASGWFDMQYVLPRIRVDWCSPSGWLIGGFASPGREVLTIHVGRAWGGRTSSG